MVLHSDHVGIIFVLVSCTYAEKNTTKVPAEHTEKAAQAAWLSRDIAVREARIANAVFVPRYNTSSETPAPTPASEPTHPDQEEQVMQYHSARFAVDTERIKRAKTEAEESSSTPMPNLKRKQSPPVLATAGMDKTARIWDIAENEADTDSYIYTEADVTLTTGAELASLVSHNDTIYSVAFSPDGKKFATASEDHTATIWGIRGDSMSSWVKLLSLVGHSGTVWCIAFSPDGSMIATASEDGTVKIWDAVVGAVELATVQGSVAHSDAVYSVAFSPDGCRLATGSADKTAKVWDITSPADVKLLRTIRGDDTDVSSVAFSPDGRMIATAGESKAVKIWSISTDSRAVCVQLANFEGHEDYVSSVAFSPDGRLLASSSLDKTAKIWNVAGHATDEWKLLTTFTGHADIINSVAFSPDGSRVATASSDLTAKLYTVASKDPAQWAEIAAFSGHQADVCCVAFSPIVYVPDPPTTTHALTTTINTKQAKLKEYLKRYATKEPRAFGRCTVATFSLGFLWFFASGTGVVWNRVFRRRARPARTATPTHPRAGQAWSPTAEPFLARN